MEPGNGGIERHLAAIQQAVTRWLEHNHPKTTEAGHEEHLLRLSLENEWDLEPPEPPEVLEIYYESKQLGVPMFEGTIFDWPAIARMELVAALNAESEFWDIRKRNAEARIAWEEKHLAKDA